MKISKNEDFEHRYTQDFRKLASDFGMFTQYERDRATRDIGLHFTQYKACGSPVVTPVLAWFQLKGVQARRLPLSKYKKLESVPLSLEASHLRFWHLCLEPTYLVLFVEAANEFLVVNAKQLIADQFGDAILSSNQKTHTLQIDRKNTLDQQAFRIILDRNIIRAFRDRVAGNDEQVRLFMRDSQLVMAFSEATKSNTPLRARIIKYMSKMRTEIYFEALKKGKWLQIRGLGSSC